MPGWTIGQKAIEDGSPVAIRSGQVSFPLIQIFGNQDVKSHLLELGNTPLKKFRVDGTGRRGDADSIPGSEAVRSHHGNPS